MNISNSALRFAPATTRHLQTILLCGLGLLTTLPVRADMASLLGQAADFTRQAAQRAYPDGAVTVAMVPMDPRLRLRPCEDLAMDVPGDRVAGRVSVRVRCKAPIAWGIYLTAKVDVILPVVTVARPVPREAILRPGDLALIEANLGELRDHYLTDLDDAVGLAARNNLRADAVLYQGQLAEPKLVSRGETVTLAAQRGHIVVTTQAIALTDGVYGEQIDLRNPRSNRVVSGWVTGPATVSVHPGAGATGRLEKSVN